MSSKDPTTKSGTSEFIEKFGVCKASSRANLRSTISNAKFEVEKFDGTNNFSMGNPKFRMC